MEWAGDCRRVDREAAGGEEGDEARWWIVMFVGLLAGAVDEVIWEERLCDAVY